MLWKCCCQPDLHHYDDWTRYLHDVDRKLAEILDTLSETLQIGPLDV